MRLLSGAVFLVMLFVLPAAAQEIPRVRAKIESFDGQILKVTTDGGENLDVGVLPTTIYLYDVKKRFSDIRQGDFVGTAAIPGDDGKLHAQEVHIFPENMRGTGEGHYPMGGDSNRSMTNAAVVGIVRAPFARGGSVRGGTITLGYRGAEKAADGTCTGRAPSNAIVCTGKSEVEVGPDVPVVALTLGDKSLLIPGAEVLMFVTTGANGKKVTPGLSVEKDGFKPLI